MKSDSRWKLLAGIGIASLLVMALINGHEVLGAPWILGWVLASLPIGLSLASLYQQRRIASQLPFPAGKYLFATELIDASDGICRIYDLDCLTGLRVLGVVENGDVGEAELQLVFGREVQRLRAPAKAVASLIMRNLNGARNTLAEALSTQMWESLSALDPLYGARYGGAWEQITVPAEERWSVFAAPQPGKFSLPSAVLGLGLGAAILLAPGLWWVDNFLRDEQAFSEARSTKTIVSFRRYLQRGESRHSTEVRQTLLPEVAWREAQATDTVRALWDFIAAYPRSSLVKKARERLHAEYGKAIDAAKKDCEPPAAAAMEKLLRWLEQHRTSVVEVRFGYRWNPSIARVEEVIDMYQEAAKSRGGDILIPSIAPGFSEEAVRRREDALIRALQQGFEKMAPRDLLEIRRGGGFSGNPIGFALPALAVQWLAELPEGNKRIDNYGGNIYLPLMFRFEVVMAVPQASPFNIKFEITPVDLLSNSVTDKSRYVAMTDLAFDEMDQQLARSFFPRYTPPLKFERVAHVLPPPRKPANLDEKVGSATGFCISRNGYIVTAEHFTRNARTFKVVTKNGLVPADLVHSDPDSDLALLKIRGGFPSALGIRSSASVRLGEAVATIGFPKTNLQGLEPKVTDGKISSLSGIKDDPQKFQISVPIQHGNSGGPLLDMQGNVIGVIRSMLNSPDSQNVNYAVKSGLLLSFLEVVPQWSGVPPTLTGDPPKFEDMVERVKQATVLLEGFGTPLR